MKFPTRPNSKLARVAIAAAGFWTAFAIGFVLLNRHRHGAEWNTLTDLFLLTVALPAGVAAIAIAFWAAGRRVAKILVVAVYVGAAATAGLSAYVHYLDGKAVESSRNQAAEHQEQLETKYGKKCAQYKDASNPFDYLVCLDKEEEQDAQKKQ
jgi:hypothetical protein